MHNNIVLECIDLCKNIKDKEIIKNINISLYEKEILGLIGPNGSGKTTTIKTILGLIKKTKGKIFINKYDIEKNYEEAISNVGAIIENPELYNYLTGYENLKISAKIYNIDKSRIEEVINLLGLQNRIKEKVSTYSLGMKQRLGIAEAILHEPKLLILDEPTNGLDPEGIKDLRVLLENLSQKEKMSIIVSSHNLKELENFCTKIIIIKNGQIITNYNLQEKDNNIKEYIIEINNTKIKNILTEYRIIDNNHIIVKTAKKNLPVIINKLIKNNIKVYIVKENTHSLEEIYIDNIGGNTID